MGMHADDDVDEEWVEKDDAEQMEMPIYNNPNRTLVLPSGPTAAYGIK